MKAMKVTTYIRYKTTGLTAYVYKSMAEAKAMLKYYEEDCLITYDQDLKAKALRKAIAYHKEVSKAIDNFDFKKIESLSIDDLIVNQ
jgi:TfoX/Sxy family transcriptional regulator of competence genes